MSRAEPPYEVVLTKAAARALEKLPEKDRRRVTAKAADLASDPRPHGVEKLTDRGDLYRVWSGNDRIVFAIDDGRRIVDIQAIGDRKDIDRPWCEPLDWWVRNHRSSVIGHQYMGEEKVGRLLENVFAYIKSVCCRAAGAWADEPGSADAQCASLRVGLNSVIDHAHSTITHLQWFMQLGCWAVKRQIWHDFHFRTRFWAACAQRTGWVRCRPERGSFVFSRT
jgi:mRNA interferase RelE/StbE